MSERTHQLRHFIAGEWIGEGGRERRNPADAADVVSISPDGAAADADAAIGAAAEAAVGWAAMPAPARGAVLAKASEILRGRAELVARDLTREEGKTLAEATGEVNRAADILRYYAGEGWRASGEAFPGNAAQTLVYSRRQPLGVVAVITPWNFPIAIPAWKAAPALVSGNAVVLKPASMTGVSGMHLARALEEAGLPAGVLNVVYGSGGAVGDALVEDPRVKGITFTGSTGVGREIYGKAAPRMARVQLEMGGKNPLVVLDDADPALAANIATAGGYGLTGQACTATSRVIVTPGAVEPFIDAVRQAALRYEPGNGVDAGVLMGPVVSESQLSVDESYVGIATGEGAEVVFGGQRRDGLGFAPTLIRGVRPEHRIAREEVFGPVISVIEVGDFDEAVHVVNDTPYGLAAGICTQDLGRAHAFADRAEAGVIKINRPTTGLDLNVPFGGVKESSTATFREQGSTAIDFFTWSKSVYVGYDA